ncbi:type I methionyl aminopeptidase [Stratiformator vulcanicus]|uniref:Methionine aminopeptidase n=1 Tax=Stratiformator vulcanicus TaxID=2527980 RepID=A0A517R0E5_9PLAN|nr:type I methionyl aminopeptidase [Stratiformator vulcanicus]QDT37376.1 Methionine aminopeptidase [Stratiformator vulcanicus]
MTQQLAPPAGAPIYSGVEIEKLRTACQFNAELLDHLRGYVLPGISTEELDEIAYDYTVDHGHKPACLGYQGYPKTICTSINDVVCHGIPNEQDVLKDGDIVNIDATTIVDGWYGDSSETFLVGECAKSSHRLVQAAFDAMHVGIRAARPYGTIFDIGRAIYLFAKYRGYSVVREYQGHGLGTEFHQEPGIPHYPHPSGAKEILRPGMVFTIEPMLNQGRWETRKSGNHEWCIRTTDRKLSAQFEHTVVITEEGAEILTQSPFGPKPGYRF